MMYDISVKALSLVMAFGALSVFATDGTLKSVAGTSPASPASWFTEENWVDNIIASGSDGTATVPIGRRYVCADQPVTIKRIFRNQKTFSDLPTFVGDGVFTVYDGIQGASLYNPVSFVGIPSVIATEFRGPVQASGAGCYMHPEGNIRLLRDKWADGPSETINDPWQFSRLDLYGSYDCTFQIPEGSESVTCAWQLTEKSRFLVRVGDAHAVAVGTVVSGDGVPVGAYVVRSFPEANMIEISAAAEKTSVSDVTFAAFSPKVHQALDSITTTKRSQPMSGRVVLNKYRPEDEFRVEVKSISSSSTYNLGVAASDGFFPGTLVLHRTADFTEGALVLGLCHVEFGETDDGTPSGWTASPVRMSSAAASARLTVTNGLSARIDHLENAMGTLVKDGDGTLTIKIDDVSAFTAAGKGTLCVAAGTLAMETSGSEGELAFSRVSVAAGATLALPAGGLRCDTLETEDGAQITGEGCLFVKYSTVVRATLGEGVRLVRVADETVSVPSEDYLDEAPAPATAETLPGNPALWVDLSVSETVETNGASRLVKLTDVRGEAYGYSSNYGSGPVVVVNADGSASHLYIGRVNTSSKASSASIAWNRKISAIKAVFKVVYTVNGGGQLLGDASYWRNTTGTAIGTPLFGNAPEAYSNAPCFYANGELRDWREGYPYNGGSADNAPETFVPTVVEFYPPDGTFSMKGFGWGSDTLLGTTTKGVNGNDRFCECLIYTNELTKAERLAIRGYLMKKWMKAEANYEQPLVVKMPSFDPPDGAAVEIPAGRVMPVVALAGEGAFVKSGSGEFVVDDAVDAARDLTVAEGQLTIRSWSLERTNLPGDPHIHLDASDADTFSGSGAALVWRDVRGDGHPAATVLNATYVPWRTENACNGLTVVSCGNEAQSGKTSSTQRNYGFAFDVCEAKTLFSVVGSAYGGGQLVGHLDPNGGLWQDSGRYNGLWRQNAAAANALLDISYASGEMDLGAPTAPGRNRFRVNGTDVSPTSTGLSEAFNLVSVASYAPVRASNLAQVRGSSGRYYHAGNQNGEFILYTNTLSRANVEKVEAYLKHKWFDQETVGRRPARIRALAVAKDAVVKVEGGAPLTLSSLAGEGTVQGSVCFAAGAALIVSADAEGVIRPMAVTGGADVSAGGVLTIDSPTTRLAVGSYPLLPVTTDGEWTIANAESFTRTLSLAVKEGYLVLTVEPKGLLLIVK